MYILGQPLMVILHPIIYFVKYSNFDLFFVSYLGNLQVIIRDKYEVDIILKIPTCLIIVYGSS